MEASTSPKPSRSAKASSSPQGAPNVGHIEEIQGVVIEAVFPDRLPEINHAITIQRAAAAAEEEDDGRQLELGGDVLVCEVQQHLGDDRVRAVAMDTTDGLARGAEVIDTGAPITVPVGEVTLGRIFNLLGEPIDLGEPTAGRRRAPRHPPGRRRASRTYADDRDVRDRHQGRSTCSPRTPRAARSGCSAAPASARRC